MSRESLMPFRSIAPSLLAHSLMTRKRDGHEFPKEYNYLRCAP